MHRTRYCNNTITALYIRRLDNLCVVLEVIVIIKIIISLGKKKKKGDRARIEPSTATTRNQYSTTTLTYRGERSEQIVHYIRDKCSTYVTISILGRSG